MSDDKYITKLNEVFGYTSFRDKQLDIIKAVLSGRDVCAIMFTSAGKSMCYQFPAIYTGKIVICVSPLISLMDDQMQKMTNLGVNSVCLNGTTYGKRQLMTNIYNNEYRLVYVTPEFIIKQEDFIKELIERELLVAVAIDELHCMSSWGHDFRPSYKELSILKSWIGNIPIIGLTATATPRVQQDCINILGLVNPLIVKTTFDRPNLMISVKLKSTVEHDILPLIADNNDPTIIYCNTRKETERVVGILMENKIPCGCYHAGLESLERELVQESFCSGTLSVIVATVAFGMGIDKEVKLIINYGMPSDLSTYIQEIGRGGRSGEQSHCILYYTPSDMATHNFLINKIEDVRYRQHCMTLLDDMKKYVYINSCRRKYLCGYFGEQLPDKCENCDNCLKKEKVNLVDVTLEACQLLHTISSLNGGYGINYYILLLRGSKDKRITSMQKRLKTYGIGINHSVEWWKGLNIILSNKGYVKDSPVVAGNGSTVSRTINGKKWFDSVCVVDKTGNIVLNNVGSKLLVELLPSMLPINKKVTKPKVEKVKKIEQVIQMQDFMTDEEFEQCLFDSI